MINFRKKTTIKQILTLLFTPLFLLSCTNNSMPISIPIQVDKINSKLETNFKIIKGIDCSLLLEFKFDETNENNRNNIKKLIGSDEIDKNGIPIDSGIPIFLRIKVSQLDKDKEIILVDGKSSTQILHSWGANSFKKKITDIFLSPGQYRVSVENLKSIQEFTNTSIFFSLVESYRGK